MKKLLFLLCFCGLSARAETTVVTITVNNLGTTVAASRQIWDSISDGGTGSLYSGTGFAGVAGTTDVFTWTRTSSGPRYITLKFHSTASGTVYQSVAFDSDATSASVEFDTWAGYTENPGGPATTFEYDRCIQNNGKTPVFYSYTDSNGVPWESPAVYPGDGFCARWTNTTGPHSVTWTARPAIPDGNGGWIDTGAYSYTAHSESGSGDGWGTEASPPSAPIVYDSGPASGSVGPEGNIDWTTPTGSDLAKDLTLQDVGDVLHNDLSAGLGNIGAQTAGTRLGVDSLGTKLDAINGTLLTGNGAAQLTALNSINAGQTAANNYLASIDAATSNVAASAATSVSQLNSIYNAIAAGDPLSDDILAKLGEIGLATESSSDGITTHLVPDITAIRAAIDVLKSQGSSDNVVLNEIEDHLDAIRPNAHNTNVSLNEIEADAEEIKDDVETIKDYTIDNHGVLDDISADTGQIVQNTDDIEPKLDGIKTAIEAAPDYTGILGDIATNTGNTADKTTSMDTTLDDIRTAVQSIDEKTPDGGDQPTQTEMDATVSANITAAGIASAAGEAALGQWANKAPSYTGPSEFVLADSDIFTIQATGLAGQTYDVSVNPLDYPAIASIAAWIKTIIAWIITVLVPYLAYQKAWDYLGPALNAQQALASGQAAAGTNYNFIASKVAAAAIVAAVTGVIVFTSTWMSGHGFSLSSAVSSPPITGAGTSVAVALHFADVFFPIATIITGTLTLIALHYALGPVTFAAWAVVKFMNI